MKKNNLMNCMNCEHYVLLEITEKNICGCELNSCIYICSRCGENTDKYGECLCIDEKVDD